MEREYCQHSDSDNPGAFTHSENLDDCGSVFPLRSAVLSVRNAKKSARKEAAEKKADERAKERDERAARKIAKENAEAARRAEREQRERGQKMRRLEIEAERKMVRREEQAANMEERRRREEEKERIMEARRYKRALDGLSRGFDPAAGMRSSGESECSHHASGSGDGGMGATLEVTGAGPETRRTHEHDGSIDLRNLRTRR